VLGPGGAVGLVHVLLPLAAFGLKPCEQRPRTLGAAFHGVGHRAALHEPRLVDVNEPAREAQAVLAVGGVRDGAGGDVGLVGVGRQHGGDPGDGGTVAERLGLGGVVLGRRQETAQRVHDQAIDVAGKLVGEIEGFRRCVHRAHIG
jgi:hypothetical protein